MHSHKRQLFLLASLSALFMFPTLAVAYTDGSIKSTVKFSAGTTGINSGYGWTVSDIGDLDNDGTPDIAVGRTGESAGTGRGGVYIHFMNTNATIRSTVHITDGTTNGPTLATGDTYGYSIANIGDLNNDGIDDIAVGSYGNDMGGAAATNRGAIFIHYMNRDGSILSTVKIGQGTANGPTLIANDRYGTEVTGIGDLDNDGIPDIAVGAVNDDTGGADRGAFYIHYMNRNGSIKSTVKIANGTANGATLINSDFYGRVSSIGDLDNDGIQDLMVGADGDDTGGSGRGAFYIHYMNRNGSIKSTVKISGATANGATLINSDSYGSETTPLGDIDADGIPDIGIGAYSDSTGGNDRGAVYLHYMNRNGSIKSTVKIASGTTNGPTIADNTYYGYGFASIGDINGDGSVDLGVGTPYEAPTITGAVNIHLMTPIPGVVVNDLHLNTAASTVTVVEGEVGNTLTLRLGSEPTSDITITPSIDGGQATLSTSTLTFTSTNWDEPQTLTVTATDDATRESTTNHTLSFVATSSDLIYNGITIANVTVNVTDNDAPAINNVPSSLSITEGANDSFEMTLNSQPANPVTVSLTPDNAQATLSDESFIFTADNWNVAQEITVTGADDAIDETTSTTNIAITTTSNDPEYNNLSVDDVVISVADNDTTGINISDASFALVEEENDTLTVSLSSQPTHTVTLNLTLDSNNVTLSSSALTFTTSDWNTPQAITISSIINDTKGATLIDSITIGISSSDTAYAGLSLSPISISVTDDESANIVLSGTALTLTEGVTDSVTVRLSSEPTNSVTVNLTSQTAQSTLSVPSLTFTTANWNVSQAVTITATADTFTEQDQNDVITFTTTSSDGNYNNISTPSIALTINDTARSSSGGSSGSYIRRTNTVSTVPAVSTPQPAKPAPDVVFTKQFLTLGTEDQEVFQLQKFLNDRGFIVATTGPGSPGNETTKFGALTKKAVIQFQKTYGILPMSGLFGPKTMSATNTLLTQ